MRAIHSVFVIPAALLAGAVQAASAPAAYPVRPVRLIVPFAPGGGTDVIARVIAQQLAEAFGQSVVVDNRPGGAGAAGTEAALRATPDGYTMIMVSGSYATNAALVRLNYDPVGDITPIAQICDAASLLALHADRKSTRLNSSH